MKKIILTLALTTAALSFSLAQPTNTVVKSQALVMGKAMVVGDGKTFAQYMLPELIQAGGGPEKVGNMMDSMFAVFKTFGGNVERISYGNPAKIVKYKKELQTTLPQTTSITSPFADIELTSTLVAISRDGGRNWYFYDPQMGQAREMKDKLPTLSPEIVIPPMQKPKVTMKQELPKQ